MYIFIYIYIYIYIYISTPGPIPLAPGPIPRGDGKSKSKQTGTADHQEQPSNRNQYQVVSDEIENLSTVSQRKQTKAESGLLVKVTTWAPQTLAENGKEETTAPTTTTMATVPEPPLPRRPPETVGLTHNRAYQSKNATAAAAS